MTVASRIIDTGLEVNDIEGNEAFAARQLHVGNLESQLLKLERMASVFARSPDVILQKLAHTAVVLCGADSAGISIERAHPTEQRFYQWVATAGQYADFLNAALPHFPSACRICIARGRPQHFRIRQRFFDLLGGQAPVVTDGLLLPWIADYRRGTVFIMAHGRAKAFDQQHCRLMERIADFTAVAVRQQSQQSPME